MSIAESLLPEFEHEMAGVRRTLERVPDDKFAWRAHEKSNTMGWLANHLADIPGWVEGTLTQDAWDLHPVGGEMYQSPSLSTQVAVLALFDANVTAAKGHLASTDDAEFAKNWSLLKQGEPVLRSTKAQVIRMWVLNHAIHHRAILTVYLRLNDLPVPALYGPSGDERG